MHVSLRSRLQGMFRLSSPEERRRMLGWYGRWWESTSRGTVNLDDLDRYLWVLSSYISLWISAVVGFLLLLVVAYAELVAGYDLSHYTAPGFPGWLNKVGFTGFHSYYHAAIGGAVFCVVAALCFLFFLLHANSESKAIFRRSFDPRLRDKQLRTFGFRCKKIAHAIAGILICSLGFFTWVAHSFAARWGYAPPVHDSVIYLLFYYVLTVAAHMSFGWFLFIFLLLLWGVITNSD